MGIVTTIPEKCRRCYTCVRECPAKAIKVDKGQAMVIAERCIACGNCIKVCAKKAKQIEDATGTARALLAGPDPVVAALAPAFPAAFVGHPAAVLTALRRLGAVEVWNVAFGAELVARAYRKLFQQTRNESRLLIASPCPAIVGYIEQYQPSLLDALVPIVSPMIATGRAIRRRNPKARVIFIGPCTAKKAEMVDPAVAGDIDCVLTFAELQTLIDDAGIDLDALEPSHFDGPIAFSGETFPLPGGLVHTAKLDANILENEILTVEGKDRVLSVLGELAKSQPRPLLVDALFCEGCIGGPIMRNELSAFARRQLLIDYINRARSTPAIDLAAAVKEFGDLDLSRRFASRELGLPIPTEDQLNLVLATMKKFTADDQLNCGACGYHTCREKAIAVFQGLAEAEMCLPHLVEELEVTCQELVRSNEDLASAQEQLVHSERLASLGQLSAGVAHEINNPLGTILLFSHVLLKQIEDGDNRVNSLKMIVSEATRCKNIVRGLLDFARKSRVSKSQTAVADLIREAVMIMENTAAEAGVKLTVEIEDNLPLLMIDAVQVKQMLVNLLQNGLDAISGAGEVKISARLLAAADAVELVISDNGCGIPREHLSKVFTPFFTTKKMGKGTGLGLAIAYGVVKMHSGEISVQSEEGKGTSIRIQLPLYAEERPGIEAVALAAPGPGQ